MKKLPFLFLLTILLISNVSLASRPYGAPVDSLEFNGLINCIAYDGENLLAATDSGIVYPVREGTYFCHEPMDGVFFKDDTIYSISTAQYFQKWSLDGELLNECCVESLYPNPSTRVIYPGLCDNNGIKFLINRGLSPKTGIHNVADDCEISLLTGDDIIYMAMLTRGLAYVDGKYWFGLMECGRIFSVEPVWQDLPDTIFVPFPLYYEYFLGFVPVDGMRKIWTAFQYGDNTKLLLFEESSDVEGAPPIQENVSRIRKIEVWPNPAYSLSSITVTPEPFTVYNIMGRKVGDSRQKNYLQLPVGSYWIKAADCSATKLLIIH